jgi:dihydrodipicolinate synthase/N-acetylneuraminate lyase
MIMFAGSLQIVPTPVHPSRIALGPHLLHATHLVDAGAAAILVLGSPREMLPPVDAEPRRILETTVDLAGG